MIDWKKAQLNNESLRESQLVFYYSAAMLFSLHF